MGMGYAKKICPRCGEMLYEDMQVCYGCLYDFSRKDNGPSEIAAALDEPDCLGARGPAAPGASPGSSGALAAEPVPAVPSPPVPPPPPAGPVSVPATPPAPEPSSAHAAAPASRPARRCDDELTSVLDDGDSTAGSPGVWVRTDSADVFVAIGEEGLFVGRGSGNQVVLHDKSVSRRHLRLRLAPGGIEAIDLGSTNPAKLRGRAIDSSALVPWGEELRLGDAVLAMSDRASR